MRIYPARGAYPDHDVLLKAESVTEMPGQPLGSAWHFSNTLCLIISFFGNRIGWFFDWNAISTGLVAGGICLGAFLAGCPPVARRPSPHAGPPAPPARRAGGQKHF